MANKGRNAVRLETEIEKSREESNWKKVIELAEQLKQRSPNQEALADFLIGEGKLECFLEECPPVDANVNKAKNGLTDTKKHLLNAITEQGKKARVALDGNLLLGKLYYACGKYDDALQHYTQAELESLTEKELPSRGLKIVAESYAIKGLCLEKIPLSTTSKFKVVEREEQITKCFELSTDLTLLYLQEVDRAQQQQQQQQIQQSGAATTGTTGSHSPLPALPNRQIGPVLETALQRAPLLFIQGGKLPQAVARYRSMLSAVESTATQSLRLTLTRQLAEVLLRGLTGVLYTPPSSTTNKIPRRPHGTSGESPWKPRTYTGLNMFVPQFDYEEVILLLLISEAMAVRDAVLSQSPEFEEARIRALENAKAVYDLLTVTVVRWGQASLLHESLERALKFSFQVPHVWLQQALCLISMGKHNHALSVLKEAKRLSPNETMPCLLAARICYEHLDRAREGLEWANEALLREEENSSSNQNLLSRCLLYQGIGNYMLSQNTTLKQDKTNYQTECYQVLMKAQQVDPNDHLIEFYLALHLACTSQITEAVAHCRTAITLRPEHCASVQLLVLLLSAQKQFQEASQLLNTACDEYPDCLNLFYVKTYLELLYEGPEVALVTAKHMLSLWKRLYEDQVNQVDGEMSEKRSDTRSTYHMYTTDVSEKDSSSLHAHSLAASRVEHALSEVASSLSSFTPKPGPQHAWLLQVQIWLMLSEIYLAMDNVTSASACVQEATAIYPISHNIMYMRGLIHEHKREFNEAKQCFQNSVSINPTHIKSLQHLGLIYHYLGCQRLAEKTLHDAAKIDPTSHQTWYNLGKVLECVEEYNIAADYMATALDVETNSPILPFNTISLPFE